MSEVFRNIVTFYGEELLAPRPIRKIYPLLAARDCLFSILAATLHIWRASLHPQSEDAPCCGDRDPICLQFAIKKCKYCGQRTIILPVSLCACDDARWRSWWTHCATSRKVAGSVPIGVMGIIHWRNLSGRTVSVHSTQPLTQMITINIFCGVRSAGA
jgi:hypothetical protein